MPPHQEESVFNMALAYLKRIDQILYLCQKAAISGDVDGWTNYLRGLYREASVRLTTEEKKDILGDSRKKIDIVKLTDSFVEDDEANFTNIYVLINNPVHARKHRRVVLFLLDKLETKLRLMLQKKGMLLPSKSDPSKAIMNT